MLRSWGSFSNISNPNGPTALGLETTVYPLCARSSATWQSVSRPLLYSASGFLPSHQNATNEGRWSSLPRKRLPPCLPHPIQPLGSDGGIGRYCCLLSRLVSAIVR